MNVLPPIPSSWTDIRATLRVTRLVLMTPRYAGVAVAAFPLMMLLFLVPRNFTLVLDTVIGGRLPLGNRLEILIGLFPLFGEAAYTTPTAVLLYVTGSVVSVNVALLVYHLTEHGLSAQSGAGGTLGALLGALGAGCASCGSALLAGVLSLVGLSGSLTLLPLDGAEFLLIALVVALLSIYWVANGLRGGMVRGCPIP